MSTRIGNRKVLAKIVFKDEGELESGDPIGPVWLHTNIAEVTALPGWMSRSQAVAIAEFLNADFEEV